MLFQNGTIDIQVLGIVNKLIKNTLTNIIMGLNPTMRTNFQVIKELCITLVYKKEPTKR